MTTQTKRKPYDRLYEEAAHAVLCGDSINHEVAQHLLDMLHEQAEEILTFEEAEERYVSIEFGGKQLLEHLQSYLRNLEDDTAANAEKWFKKPIEDLEEALES